MCLAPIGIDLVEALVERVVMYLLDPSAHGKAAHSFVGAAAAARVAAGRASTNHTERPTWSQLRSRDSCRRLLVQANTCPTAAPDGVMGRKADLAALLWVKLRVSVGPMMHMWTDAQNGSGVPCSGTLR